MGEKTPELSIIIPVYNEEENLPPLHEELLARMEAFGRDYEILYVDDGSADASWKILGELHAQNPDRVRLLRFRRNFGQTAALAAGFDAARGELIIPMDADMQNDPADIPAMVEKAEEGYDVVSGWRRKRQDVFLTRRLPSKIANGLISAITQIKLHDYGCTLKIFRRDIVKNIHLYGEMHRFLPALAMWSGASVVEMEVNHRQRLHGKGKYGLDRITRVVLDLITVKFLLSYSTRPMQVFGRWGLYSIAFGFLMGLIMILRKFLPPYEDITGTPWLYLSIFFTLGGLQMMCMGLLGEINVRTYYETQQKSIYSLRERVGFDETSG
ncbi:MAG: glycosyltransferase family 2 protein [Candidatus Sumerlaeia bacterium]